MQNANKTLDTLAVAQTIKGLIAFVRTFKKKPLKEENKYLQEKLDSKRGRAREGLFITHMGDVSSK